MAMSTTVFDRDQMAKWYAARHLLIDPGVVSVHYLPTDADEREIRFVEVNRLMAERNDKALEPIDFGVDMGKESFHTLVVLDVTPRQWEKICEGDIDLPPGWSQAGAIVYRPHQLDGDGNEIGE